MLKSMLVPKFFKPGFWLTDSRATSQLEVMGNVFILSINHIPILTHWSRVTHICVSKLTNIGSDNGLPPSRRQAIISTKCWYIVNWSLGNKFQWNLNQNQYIFIQENAFESVVCEMAAILSQPQCVKLSIMCCHIPHMLSWLVLFWKSTKMDFNIFFRNPTSRLGLFHFIPFLIHNMTWTQTVNLTVLRIIVLPVISPSPSSINIDLCFMTHPFIQGFANQIYANWAGRQCNEISGYTWWH